MNCRWPGMFSFRHRGKESLMIGTGINVSFGYI
jgi:hypothetical protein